MKLRLFAALLLFLPLSVLISQDSLNRIQVSEEEVSRELERLVIQGQLQNIEYSEEEKESLKENVREGIIMRKLLLSLATYRELEITEEEVDALEARARGDYPEEEWIGLLESQLHTRESLRKMLKESLLIDRILQLEVLDKITVSDEEVLAYYKAHPEDFTTENGLLPLSYVKDMIREALETRKGQEESARFMSELYSRAMFVEE